MSRAVHPLTPGRWPDFEALMGPKGAVGGCWCMLWRLPARDWRAGCGEPNRRAMEERVAQSPPPGLLAYDEAGAPVGWISVAPRAEFPRMAGSRILAPVDDVPVWSITCFFIRASARRKGFSRQLIDAACDFAQQHGAGVVEAYPVDPGSEPYASGFAWTGIASAFSAAGFREVARRSEKRPIMRRVL